MFKRHQFNVLTGLLAFSLIGGFISSASSFAESATPVTAVAPPMTKQNLASIKTKITEFLETQTIGYPGKVSVHAGAIDPNLKLAQCPDMQVFMPTGSRAWGKTSVGVRCNAPNACT